MDKKKIPQHVAIIMDGNGRWAQRRGLSRSEGHHRGMLALKGVIKDALGLGIKFLTVYAFSTENWKRSQEEVLFLMRLCEDVITQELPYMIQNDIRLRHIGRRDGLSESLQNCIVRTETLTQSNHRLCFQLAFNYGARYELTEAVRQIVELSQRGEIALFDITEESISKFLYTAGIPDPDLLIRTSGEMRVSNFLLWQIAYSEIYVTKKYWPDFNKRELTRAIENYQKRQRRYGGIDD